jgi:hypothetical protein
VPEVVDQSIARNNLASVEHEQREQGALLTAPESERPTVVHDLDRAEDAELHASMLRKLQGICNALARGGEILDWQGALGGTRGDVPGAPPRPAKEAER